MISLIVFYAYKIQYISSRFEIAIDVNTIIISHVFIQTKFCVWGVEGTKISFEKQKWPIIIFLTLKFLFQSDLNIDIRDKNCIFS